MMTLLLIALVWMGATTAFMIALGRAASRELPHFESVEAASQPIVNRAA